MERVKPRWSVRKHDGRWRVYDHDTWACTFDTLDEAHNEAMCNAVADVLYQPGGLNLLAELKHAYEERCRDL